MSKTRRDETGVGVRDYIPRLIHWEITKSCNLTCKHCRKATEYKAETKELPIKEIKIIMNEINDVSKPIICLTGGEPLYRRDIFEITDYASRKGFPVELATNGTLINREIARNMKETNIQRVAISLDGATPVTHDRFRGINGSFYLSMQGVRYLRHTGVPFQFNLTITKYNLNSVNEVVQLALAENAKALHLFIYIPVGCGLEISDEMMLSIEEYEKILRWVFSQSRKYDFEIKVVCAPQYYRIIREVSKENNERISFKSHGMTAITKGCLAGNSMCFISHSGQVRPCGNIALEAGHLKRQTFSEVWNHSALFSQLRDPRNREGKCGECEYIFVCSGCRARAFSKTGNVLAEEPLCTYKPVVNKAMNN